MQTFQCGAHRRRQAAGPLALSEQDAVRHGALLHDVGKLAIRMRSSTSPGPTARRCRPEDAVAELRDKSGTQFDPQVVAALLKRLRVPALSPSASAVSAS